MTEVKYFSGNVLSLSEDICNKMLANISKGIWKEGQKIPSESALCELFGASRISIRSAIKLLQGQGFLTTRPGIGSFVNIPRREFGINIGLKQGEWGVEQCRKLVDFRLLVEGEAMRLFCENAKEEHYHRLKNALEGMRDITQGAKEFTEHDLRFHFAILEGAQNEYLYNAFHANLVNLHDYFHMVICAMEAPFQQQMYDRHLAIYTDLLRKNVKGAIIRINTELNYCYVEMFDEKKFNSGTDA